MYFDIKERTDTEYVQIKINVNELKIIQRRIKQNEKVCFFNAYTIMKRLLAFQIK